MSLSLVVIIFLVVMSFYDNILNNVKKKYVIDLCWQKIMFWIVNIELWQMRRPYTEFLFLITFNKINQNQPITT